MKKIVLFAFLTLAPLISSAQDIFDKYEDNDEVTFVAMQPKMFQMLAKMSISVDDPEAQDFFKLVKSISSFKVITTEDGGITKDIDSWVTNRLKSSTYEELMRVRDEGSNVKFYVKEGKDDDHVKELLMFVTGLSNVKEVGELNVNGRKLETVLLSLTGDIDLTQIGNLTEKMNLPGGKELEKAGKKSN